MLDHIIRVSKVVNSPITKGTLYKWSHYGKHPEIFVKLEGMLFVDLKKLKALLEKHNRGTVNG